MTHTGKLELLKTILDENGPIRPTMSNLNRNSAFEISEILNNIQTADDTADILGYIAKFQRANRPNATLTLGGLEQIINLERIAKSIRSGGNISKE